MQPWEVAAAMHSTLVVSPWWKARIGDAVHKSLTEKTAAPKISAMTRQMGKAGLAFLVSALQAIADFRLKLRFGGTQEFEDALKRRLNKCVQEKLALSQRQGASPMIADDPDSDDLWNEVVDSMDKWWQTDKPRESLKNALGQLNKSHRGILELLEGAQTR